MIKIITIFSLFFLVITMSACTSFSTSQPPTTGITPPEEIPFVDINSNEKRYTSATGQVCQVVRSETGRELYCFDGHHWQRVPAIYE